MKKKEVTNNKRQQQFEILLGDHKAEIVYRLRKNTLFLLHTFVPEEMRGQGIATLLVTTALEHAKVKGHLLAVLCPYVAAYVKKHPEWYVLYDKAYHQNIPSN